MTLDELARRSGEDVRRLTSEFTAPEWSGIERSQRQQRMVAGTAAAVLVAGAAVAAVWAYAPGAAPAPPDPAAPVAPTTVATTTSTTPVSPADTAAIVVRTADGTELARLTRGEEPDDPLVRAALDEIGPLTGEEDVLLTLGVDPQAQQHAEATLASWLAGSDVDGAIVTLDNETGAIIAVADTSDGAFLAADARPVAQLAHPLLAVAALESGYGLDSTWDTLSPAEVVIDGAEVTCENAGGRSGVRDYSLHDAVVLSVNTVFCHLIAELGSEAALGPVLRVWPVGGEAGPGLATGDVAVSPLEVAAAYRALATGAYRSPRLVEDASGTDLAAPAESMLFDAEHLAVLGEALREAVEHGTAGRAALDGEVAGKTGTSSSDVWFVGSTDAWTTVVWVGRDDGTLENVEVRDRLYSIVFGGTLAAPIWKDVTLRHLDSEG